jgi:hypothetical protein
MQQLNQLQTYLKKSFPEDSLPLRFFFSLCCELLIILYLFFFFLWTTEVLLPGFISFRVSLAPYFALLLVFTYVLALLGEYLNLSFTKELPFQKTLLTFGFIWGIAIIAISLIDFPWWSILIILGFFIITVSYFYLSLFKTEK